MAAEGPPNPSVIRVVNRHTSLVRRTVTDAPFRSGNLEAFELVTQLYEQSRKHDLGNVTRIVNIPMVGMMNLRPQVRKRSTFKHDDDESLARRIEEYCTTSLALDAIVSNASFTTPRVIQAAGRR